jgi:uncharacterized delta-60 repeat protein
MAKKCLLWLAFSLLLSSTFRLHQLFAAPVDVDLSFDTDGRVITDINSFFPDETSTGLYDLGVARDGSIIGIGGVELPPPEADRHGWIIAVARYLNDGRLDTTFGSGGIMTPHFSPNHDEGACCGFLTGSNQIVMGIRITDEGCFLVRLKPDGSKDTSFGPDESPGMAPLVFNGDVRKIALGERDTIWAIGDSAEGAYVARFMPDGSRDAAFGGDGRVFLPPDRITFMHGDFLPLENGGSLVLGRRFSIGPAYSGSIVVVARLTREGQLDPSFGGDGFIDIRRDAHVNEPAAIALQGPDKILVLFNIDASGAILRLNWDGSVDTSFHAGYPCLLDTYLYGGDLAVSDDNKIIINGYNFFTGQRLLLRLDENGFPDPGFGAGGESILPLFLYNHILKLVDHRILIGGSTLDGKWDIFRYVNNVPIPTTRALMAIDRTPAIAKYYTPRFLLRWHRP